MLRVTPVLRDEYEPLFRMVRDYWAEHYADRGFMREPDARAKRFHDEFWRDADFRYLWWARLDGPAIGFAKTELLEDPAWETQGDIGDFYIAPPFRLRGHGTAFVRWLLDWFIGRGVKSVRLFVRLDNPGALAFWRREGFETVQVWHQMRKAVR
jgi:GNAT superfamily N-acetyltransferase